MTTSNEPTVIKQFVNKTPLIVNVLKFVFKEMQGSLFKWTNMMKGYQHRWFVMDEKNGLLSYYTVTLTLFFSCINFFIFLDCFTVLLVKRKADQRRTTWVHSIEGEYLV